MTPFIAEIIGTFLLILLGCSVVANAILNNTKGGPGNWMIITTGWALAVYVGVVVASPYSGAHINPAVTIGLAIAGVFPWDSVPSYVLAQFIGAILGATVTWYIYKDHFNTTEDQALKLAVFSTSPVYRNPFLNVVTELVATFVLIFTVLYFTDATLSDSNTVIGLGSLGALPVALLVWSIGLSLGGPTGYAINPARDLGPRIAHAILPIKNKGGNDWSYSWVPVLGPVLGGIAGGLLYLLLS